jgi:hypothetical protein
VDEERTLRILDGIGAQWSNLESANDQVEPLENYLNGLRAVHEVRARLLEALELSQASQEHFLPIDKLESIMTFAVIRELVQNIFPSRIKDHQEALALRICGIYGVEDPGMRRIFTILILIDKAHAITDFVDGNVRDSDLPLKLAPKTYATTFYKAQGASLTGSASEIRLTVPESWTESELDSFSRRQPTVLAPYFDLRATRITSYKLDSTVVLPFIRYENHSNRPGGGSVWRAQIHPAHSSPPLQVCGLSSLFVFIKSYGY